jgi:DNA-binding transcriptional MerR regulator
LTIRDKRKETERNPTPKQLQRRKRTLELHVKGLTIPQINKALHDEHFETSEHTVFDDVHSQTADEYKEELERQQRADITMAKDDLKVRLEYRDRMIDRLTPKKIEQKIEGSEIIRVEIVDNSRQENSAVQDAS